jgi:hypothetical protein
MKNIIKEISRNDLNYMEQINKTVLDSLKKIKVNKC